MRIQEQKECLSVRLVLFSILLHLGSSTEYFTIFRRRSVQPSSQQDMFQTPHSLCRTASIYRCHDYGAQQTTCNSCTCPRFSGTFGYINDQWKCVGKNELRQDTGCSVKVKGELQDQPLLVIRSGSRYFMDLPINQICSYSYTRDTYYRTCNGTWSAAGGIGGGSRYVLDVRKRQNRYRYWLNVKSDSQAVNALQGRIIKLNVTCSNRGSSIPLNQCFLFKEPYFNRPISCPIYQVSSIAKPLPSFIPTSNLDLFPNSTLVNQTVQSTKSPGTASLFQTSTTLKVQTSSAPNVTNHSQADKGAQYDVDKKVIISVSAVVGALFVVIAIAICIVVCKRRKRNLAAMYTAALYNVSQDQCSAGIYDETHISLPASLKSASLMSHSNPGYQIGQDMSIKVKSSRHASSPSRLQHDEPDDSKVIENESMFTDAAAAQPIKGRRNMIVAYENVIILADTQRDSVPDAEAFYENPGSSCPHYHVLERSEEVPSYASCPSGSHMEDETRKELYHDSFQDEGVQDPYNDMNDDEPIYANGPASPESTASNPRDSNFSFNQPDSNYDPSNEDNVSSFDGAGEQEDWDIYANSEAIRSSYLKENAINNPGYVPDDEEELNDPVISTDDPIYDNQINFDDGKNGQNKSGTPPYASLRDQSDEGTNEDLRVNSSVGKTADYQSLSPVTRRKHPQPKAKPKPKVPRKHKY